MYDLYTAFELLGIAPTQDRKGIRKAYAERVKECHPEEKPEEWKRLHDAYETALNYARGGRGRQDGNLADWKTSPGSFSRNKEEKESDNRDVSEVEEKESDNRDVSEVEEKESDNRDISKTEEKNPEEKFWEELERQTEEEKREAVAVICKRLDDFTYHSGRQKLKEWKKLLNSSDWKKGCEEEVVLKCLLKTVGKMEFSKEAAKWVQNVLEELQQKLRSSMQASKAALVEGSIKTIRENEESVKRRQKVQRIFGKIMAAVMVLVFLTAVVLWVREGAGERVLSETEAATEIVSYLNQKYPELSIAKEELRLEKMTEFSLQEQKTVQIGYCAAMGKDGAVMLLFGENKRKAGQCICLDNLQAEQIRTGMEKEILEELDIKDGRLCFPAGENEENVYFHAKYEGDCAAFFRQETANRDEMFSVVRQAKLQQDRLLLSLNSRCTIYLRDPEMVTVAESLKNQDKPHLMELEKVLETKAKAWKIPMEGIVLPQEVYDGGIQNISLPDVVLNRFERYIT